MTSPLQSLAVVRARLDAGVPLAEALPEGVTEEAWPELQQETLVSFADALERGNGSMLAEYKAAYEKAYAEHAGVETELPIDDQRDERRRAAAVPTVPHTPAAAPSPDETSFLSAGALVPLEPVPFSSQGGGSAPQPLEELAPHASVGETGFLDAEALGVASLPFGGGSSTDQEQPSLAGSVDETAFVTAIPDTEVLPFAGQSAPPSASPTSSPHPQTGGTSHVQVSDGSVPEAALPFASTHRGNEDLGGLTLQQLAALEVEVAHAVGRVPEVLAHFGVDAEVYRRLKQTFAQRIATDPSLAQVFDTEKAAYLAWRSAQKR